MSNLRNVRLELEKMQRETKAKKAELRREQVKPVVEAITKELLNSEAVQEELADYSKDKARVIAKHIDLNIEEIIDECYVIITI